MLYISMDRDQSKYDACVKTSMQDSRFKRLPGHSLYMNRTTEHPVSIRSHIAYTENWVIFIGDTRDASVKIHTDTEEFRLPPFGAILVPPFSLIDWEFGAGRLHYKMWYLSQPYHQALPLVPCFIGIDELAFESDYETILQYFLDPSQDKTLTAPTKPPTQLANTVKQVIQSNFTRTTTIRSLLDERKISHAAGSRAFHSAYGIQTQKYRMLLRMMRAQEDLLIQQKTVTETGLAVGFNDLGQFYRHFKKFTSTGARNYLNSTPRQPNK